MREIKFRGKPKNTDRQDYVYGWGCFTDENERKFIVVNDNQFIQVEKIEQYTGLKDKNGTEIYEGDIVEITKDIVNRENYKEMEKYKFNLYVKWQRYCELNISDYFLHPDNTTIKVIGNIYENPELLKV